MDCVLDEFKRTRDMAKLDEVGIAAELLNCFVWDQKLRRALFHVQDDDTPEFRKKLSYHIDRNSKHIINACDELVGRGRPGITELERLYCFEDHDLKYWLGVAAISCFPESAAQVLTRLLAGDTLSESHRAGLTKRLGAIQRRLAGAIKE